MATGLNGAATRRRVFEPSSSRREKAPGGWPAVAGRMASGGEVAKWRKRASTADRPNNTVLIEIEKATVVECHRRTLARFVRHTESHVDHITAKQVTAAARR